MATAWRLLVGMIVALPCAALAQTVQGVTPTEVVLGMHADLSGVASVFGVPVANAFRMRIDEVNAAGGIRGRKLRLVVEDTQYQVPKAIQAGNKLINSDKVFAIVGATGAGPNNAVLPLELKANVPNLFPISWLATMSEPVDPLKYGIYETNRDQMRSAIRYMVEEKKKKAVCAMYQDNDFGHDVFDGVTAQLKAMNLPLVASASHKPTEQDFTATITKFREAKCDLIAVGTIVRDSIVPYSTARKMGWNDVDFVGSSASYDLAVAGAQGGSTEGFYSVGFFDPPYRDTANPLVAKWFDAYKARFGTDPAIQAALGEVIMDLVIKAIDGAGQDLNVKSLVKSLESIRDYKDMFNGPVQSLSPTSHSTAHSSVIYVVHNGRWARVGESSGQRSAP